MKIKSENNVFIIPVSDKPILLVDNGYKNEILDLLNGFFTQKKKTKCRVFDDNGEEIKCDDAEFIYISSNSSIDSNFYIKNKSLLNVTLTNMFNENQENFTSIEKIRESLKDLVSDKGMFEIDKILNYGIDDFRVIEFNELGLNSILENYFINTEEFSNSRKFMMLYNVSIYLKRKDFKIIYIDFPIDEMVVKWIKTISKDSLILIDNEAMNKYIPNNFEMLIMSNNDYLEELETNEMKIKNASYLFHPVVRANIEQQIEKNIRIMNEFLDTNTTFYLKLDSQKV